MYKNELQAIEKNLESFNKVDKIHKNQLSNKADKNELDLQAFETNLDNQLQAMEGNMDKNIHDR